jgi:hypothetical protein
MPGFVALTHLLALHHLVVSVIFDFRAQSGPSATYDAFIRLHTGQGERSIADKINDPNRMTWDQFKKVRTALLLV